MISDTTVKVSYSTDGAQTSFPITFEFSDNSHIEVYLLNNSTGYEEKLVDGDDYNVSGLNVVTVQTYGEGYTLTIVRAHPSTQTLDLEDGGAMPADDLEDRLDRITQILQQHEEKLSRALLLPVTSGYSDLTHPIPEDDHFMVWRDGKLTNVQHFAGAGNLSIASFMQDFIESADTAEALLSLGIGIGELVHREDYEASDAQTIFVLESSFSTSDLFVYRNGLLMRGNGNDYTETPPLTVTFTDGLNSGDKVTFVIIHNGIIDLGA